MRLFPLEFINCNNVVVRMIVSLAAHSVVLAASFASMKLVLQVNMLGQLALKTVPSNIVRQLMKYAYTGEKPCSGNTLIRKSPRWCVLTQPWGRIAVTNQVNVSYKRVIPLKPANRPTRLSLIQ